MSEPKLETKTGKELEEMRFVFYDKVDTNGYVEHQKSRWVSVDSLKQWILARIASLEDGTSLADRYSNAREGEKSLLKELLGLLETEKL